MVPVLAWPSDPIAPFTLEHIEQLIALCPVAIVDIDASQRVRHCNPAFEHLFGYRTGEPLNRTFESVVGFEENDEAVSVLGRRGSKPLHLTLQTHRKDQTPLDLELDVIPQKRTGRSAGYWGILQDVTARRSAEATLSKVTQTMIEAQERERFRIAKELHDDVAQGLTVLQLGMERLKTGVASARTGITEQLEKLQAEAKRISASVRTLSLDLDVPMFGLLAIDRTLERLCDDVMARRGIKVHCRISRLPGSMPHAIAFRYPRSRERPHRRKRCRSSAAQDARTRGDGRRHVLDRERAPTGNRDRDSHSAS